MKSNQSVIIVALLFLIFATVSSVTIWGNISSAVKIGMFAFGFGAGIAAATIIARHRNILD